MASMKKSMFTLWKSGRAGFEPFLAFTSCVTQASHLISLSSTYFKRVLGRLKEMVSSSP